jgi:hypothetical protein
MQDQISNFLKQKNWAVIGVSTDPNKYGYKVYFQLKKNGYNVYAINPKLESIEGDPVYSNLSMLPEKPDVVSIVIPPKATEQIIPECIRLKIPRVWMQPGCETNEAISKAEENGITVIHNHCVIRETSKNEL